MHLKFANGSDTFLHRAFRSMALKSLRESLRAAAYADGSSSSRYRILEIECDQYYSEAHFCAAATAFLGEREPQVARIDRQQIRAQQLQHFSFKPLNTYAPPP